MEFLLGHLTGDYLLQPKDMAIHKADRNWRGWRLCTLHCLLYTAALALWWWTIDPWALLAVFATHWPVDRYSLAHYWSKLIRGRRWDRAGDKWDVAFTALVYAVVDNTFHLICLYGIERLLVT